MKAKSAKAKGTRLEKWVVDMFSRIGIKARKQPGGGVYSAFPHDVTADIPHYGPVIIECKSWKQGWRTGDKAMGQADLLVIKRDFGDPCVYMPWKTFSDIMATLEQLKE